MKSYRYIILAIIFMLVLAVFSGEPPQHDTIFQYSIIDALLQGIYDGDMTFNELRRNGNFGLGTFNALDGEMVFIDNRFFQIKDDGKAYPVQGSQKTPFAVVTFFETDKKAFTKKINTFKELEHYLDSKIHTNNIFYAFRIDGNFDYIKARSVSPQKKPYPHLSEAIKTQTIFEFNNINGTLLGFKYPAYIGGINVPGYRFHFITRDRTAGGHLLDCRFANARVSIDHTYDLNMLLPRTRSFYKATLSKNKPGTLQTIESSGN